MTCIRLITLGGTISSQPAEGTDGVVPVSGADSLRRGLERWLPGIELEAHDFRLVPSPSLTLDDILALRVAIAELPADVDGVVVSQGTDTIEETAYALDLLGAASERPVVVTGAMRDRAAPGGDGPANLVAAILTAASPLARGTGVLVQFADVVHAARWVTKRSTFRVDAFTSEPLGPVGAVVEGSFRLAATPRLRPGISTPDHADARVAVVAAGMGDDLALLPALAGVGYDSVVLAAMGAGHVSAAAAANVAAAARERPVVLCSRTGTGPAFTRTYGYPGGEIDLLSRGAIPGGHLSAPKARILLMLLLSQGLTGDLLRAAFLEHST
ncbi:MAG: asparaginase [Cellulomonadaceae bacterium]